VVVGGPDQARAAGLSAAAAPTITSRSHAEGLEPRWHHQKVVAVIKCCEIIRSEGAEKLNALGWGAGQRPEIDASKR
jgi:hypothetical protein